MNERHEPLTPEERELAQRLARLGASAQPSPALDARILAAAGASTVAAGTGAPRRVRARWAVGFGLAASLALAVGVAWQLRPLPGARVDYPATSHAEATAEYDAPLAAEMPATDNAQAAAMQDGDAAITDPAPDPTPVPPPAPAAPQAPGKQATAVPSGQAAANPPTALSGPPTVAADAAAPSAFPAPPPAPVADQPPAAAPASGSAARTAAPQAATRQRETGADTAMESTVQREAGSLHRAEAAAVSGSEQDDAFVPADDVHYDDEPPASADSPEVRKAWLARIRELVNEGREDAARASLAEFRRRYPQAPLPDDLRPLLD